MTEPPLLEAVGLSAGYGTTPIVSELDLHVSAGEVVALLGPNGAGKTTTLMTLAGALPPLAGDIRWLGQPTAASLHARARAGTAFVTEDRSVFMQLTVRDNLRVGRCDPERAFEIFPELRPLSRRRAGLLSGGEQQMLTLGRAFARHPRVLLVDELSLGLAPLLVRRLLDAVRAAASEYQCGILLVEQHVRQVLERAADRAYVLNGGRIVLDGDAATVKSRIAEIEQTYLSAPRTPMSRPQADIA